MNRTADTTEYLQEQYRTSANFDARLQLDNYGTNPQGWYEWLFDHLDLPPVCRILELGCGHAVLWATNLGRIPRGWEITLSDLSPGMIEAADANIGQSLHPFQFGLVDAQEIPFGAASFDAVIANHMLYHVSDRPQAFSEIARILRPGGKFFASTVGQAHMREISEVLSKLGVVVPNVYADRFGLENGSAQLEPYFSSVVCDKYNDTLVVPKAEPIVAYIRSMVEGTGATLPEAFLTALRGVLGRMISETGAFSLTKEAGVFTAIRANE